MMCSIRRTKREMVEDLPETPIQANMIGHSTLEWVGSDGVRRVRFHRTDVVTFGTDGSVILDSGGHRSNTTKKRMNEHAPCGVYQAKHVWYVSTPVGSFEFFDGFAVDRHGLPTAKTIVTMIEGGDFTRDQLANLPPDLQVALDVVLGAE